VAAAPEWIISVDPGNPDCCVAIPADWGAKPEDIPAGWAKVEATDYSIDRHEYDAVLSCNHTISRSVASSYPLAPEELLNRNPFTVGAIVECHKCKDPDDCQRTIVDVDNGGGYYRYHLSCGHREYGTSPPRSRYSTIKCSTCKLNHSQQK
jgi:hypothetical protein